MVDYWWLELSWTLGNRHRRVRIWVHTEVKGQKNIFSDVDFLELSSGLEKTGVKKTFSQISYFSSFQAIQKIIENLSLGKTEVKRTLFNNGQKNIFWNTYFFEFSGDSETLWRVFSRLKGGLYRKMEIQLSICLGPIKGSFLVELWTDRFYHIQRTLQWSVMSYQGPRCTSMVFDIFLCEKKLSLLQELLFTETRESRIFIVATVLGWSIMNYRCFR